MTGHASIAAAVQSLEPGAVVELWELDGTSLGGSVQRFHGHQQEEPIWFQGLEYQPWPIEAEGFARTSANTPQPTLTVSNYGGVVTALCMSYQDLVGWTLTRRRTLVRFLDAASFDPPVNPEANPSEEFQPEVWLVERKAYEDRDKVQFELASAMDFEGQQLPGRIIVSSRCLWLSIGGYRGEFCGYAGGPVAMADDTPTSDPALDRCSGRVVGCKLRFGADSPLPFGSFPAAGMMR